MGCLSLGNLSPIYSVEMLYVKGCHQWLHSSLSEMCGALAFFVRRTIFVRRTFLLCSSYFWNIYSFGPFSSFCDILYFASSPYWSLRPFYLFFLCLLSPLLYLTVFLLIIVTSLVLPSIKPETLAYTHKCVNVYQFFIISLCFWLVFER